MVLESLHPPWFPLQVPRVSELGREDGPSSAQGCRSLPAVQGFASPQEPTQLPWGLSRAAGTGKGVWPFQCSGTDRTRRTWHEIPSQQSKYPSNGEGIHPGLEGRREMTWPP